MASLTVNRLFKNAVTLAHFVLLLNTSFFLPVAEVNKVGELGTGQLIFG